MWLESSLASPVKPTILRLSKVQEQVEVEPPTDALGGQISHIQKPDLANAASLRRLIRTGQVRLRGAVHCEL